MRGEGGCSGSMVRVGQKRLGSCLCPGQQSGRAPVTLSPWHSVPVSSIPLAACPSVTLCPCPWQGWGLQEAGLGTHRLGTPWLGRRTQKIGTPGWAGPPRGFGTPQIGTFQGGDARSGVTPRPKSSPWIPPKLFSSIPSLLNSASKMILSIPSVTNSIPKMLLSIPPPPKPPNGPPKMPAPIPPSPNQTPKLLPLSYYCPQIQPMDSLKCLLPPHNPQSSLMDPPNSAPPIHPLNPQTRLFFPHR